MDLDALYQDFGRPPPARVPDSSADPAAPTRAKADQCPGDPAGVSRETADDTPRREFGGFSLADLQSAAGEDWPDIKSRPGALKALVALLRTSAQRERGERPDHYTNPVLCANCGPVWLFPGAPKLLHGCPWCLGGHSRADIPRPAVRCGTCRHFNQSKTTPAAGLGQCRIDAPGSHCGPALWPKAERICGAWRPRPPCNPTETAHHG